MIASARGRLASRRIAVRRACPAPLSVAVAGLRTRYPQRRAAMVVLSAALPIASVTRLGGRTPWLPSRRSSRTRTEPAFRISRATRLRLTRMPASARVAADWFCWRIPAARRCINVSATWTIGRTPVARTAPSADAAPSRRPRAGAPTDPAPLRVCPETSGWIAEFSEHEAD
jgi:hypothetical protein